MYKGIFVDDRDQEYAELLSDETAIEFSFQGLEDIMDLRQIILQAEPNIVALDYRLDENLGNLPASKAFKGGPLAQLLRDAAVENPNADFPIVLVSSEQKIRERFDPDKTAHDLFDEVIVKEEIQSSSELSLRKVLNLCEAYERLRDLDGDYDILTLVDLPEEERPYVDHQELVFAVEEAKAPHIVARIFSKFLLSRNGLLVDEAELCARFGVAQASLEHVVAVLEAEGVGRYTGLLSSENKRWWAHHIDGFLKGVFGKRPTGMRASDRVKILNERYGDKFEPALSTWIEGDEGADELIAFACVCCGRGTELRHSVAIYEAPQPSFTLRRRLCWDCIQTDSYKTGQKAFQIQKSDQALIQKILSGRQ